MQKIVVSVLGRDRPGVVALVSRVLFDQGANIEDVSQTILQAWFSGTFIATMSNGDDTGDLARRVSENLAPEGLHVSLFPLMGGAPVLAEQESEPFVVTTMGSDKKGLVAGISEVMASFGVNIASLRAVFRGGESPADNVMIYEVDVPAGVDRNRLKEQLRARAAELGLELSMQHKRIFETLCRI
ncbi:MAG: glycine cleavage system protein R [Desulfatibacillaceae bacterium]